MLKRLPAFVEPIRWAEEGRSISGETDIADMDRLQDYLSRTEARVEVSIDFGVDELNHKYLHGRLSTRLWMICQRCVQEMQVPVTTEFTLGLVTSEAKADELPPHYDPLVVTHKPMKLSGILEDELILALPIVPLHEQCESGVEAPPANTAVSNGNPFAVLKQFKSKRK